MSPSRLLSALAAGATRRPALVVGVALVLGLGGAALALGLHPSAEADTFVGSSSAAYRATQRYYASFGEEPVDVVVQGNLQQLVLSSDIEQLAGLEGCLSGTVPAAGLAQEGGESGPCGQLEQAHTVKVVLGPGTFIAEAARQSAALLAAQNKEAQAEAAQAESVVRAAALARGHRAAEASALGKQASKITLTRYAQEVLSEGLRYGLRAVPSISDPNFVTTLVFNPTGKPGTPKQRFAYLFPSRETALISVRMRAGLSQSERTHTIALIRQAVAMPQWRLAHGESYLVTGEPAIVADLTGSISHTLLLLLVAVALVMALTLGLVFSGRPRLLPLALAGLACALTFGALALVGGALSIAQVAVLPVLVGLAVDYAIQFQSRVGEENINEERAAHGMPGAVRKATAAGAPTIALACVASAAGVLVLELSPVPMVRGFGLLLVVGLGLAFLCALVVGSAAMVLVGSRDGRAGTDVGQAPSGGEGHGVGEGLAEAGGAPMSPGGSLAAGLAGAWHGAREVLHDNPLTRLVEHAALVVAVRRPGRVLAVGLALAVLGWGLDTQTQVQTDITKLVPQNMASLRNLNTLERASGVGGEIDMMVSSKSLTTPATIEWMSSYEAAVLKRFGYTSTRGCGQAQLCPAFSLPSLFGGEEATPAKLSQAEIDGLLAVLPPYFSQEVIAPGRQTATLAFGIRLMGLAQQQQVIEGMRSELHPPAGVSVQLVGLPVLAAQADAQVASVWRRMLTLLVGLLAVGLVLLAAFRGDGRRALAPLLPVALATGWSALIVFLLRVPLNPMSVTLGALVLAVSTEFSVLLAERHRQERIAGASILDALRHAYRRTGAAVAASGVTAIAGFGVLALSDIQMLRDFGIVTLVDLSVSLVGVLVALPAALLVVERGALPSRSRRRVGVPLARHDPA